MPGSGAVVKAALCACMRLGLEFFKEYSLVHTQMYVDAKAGTVGLCLSRSET